MSAVTITNPTQFALGDGVTASFRVAVGVRIAVASIYRQDWQGNQLLYPTPRTNLLTNSEGVLATFPTTGGGVTNAPVSIANFDASLQFVLGADKFAYKNFSTQIGTTYTLSVFVQMDDNGAPVPSVSQLSGDFSLVLQSVVVATSIQSLPGNIYKISGTLTAASGNVNYGVVKYSTQSARGFRVSGYMLSADNKPTAYIKTVATAVTLTDYTVTPYGFATFAQTPVSGAILRWTGSYESIFPASETARTDPVISQYANSPTLRQLIDSMSTYFDPSVNFQDFYNFVWNIDTAVGFGLDIWGRIVNVSRTLTIPGNLLYFGFSEQGAGAQPFGQAPFYAGIPATQSYVLSDDAYRILILTKALSNISNSTAASLNAQLRQLFAGRGRCYVVDLGGMAMMFTFEFELLPYEIAILTQSGAIPTPAGVSAQVMQLDALTTFGFSEQGGTAQPFGQGVFFNPAIGIIPVA